MVSFFGFKIGGEKKKKHVNDIGASPAPLRKKLDRDVLGEGQFSSRDGMKNAPYSANVYSISRPDTSHSYKITATRTKPSLYDSNAANLAAMSMSELSQPKSSHLKHAASNPALGKSWYNSSTPDLVPPVPMRNPSRPSTPVNQQPAWINPLEMHSTKSQSPRVTSASKSPLAQPKLKLEIPSKTTPPFRDQDAPEPLRIRRPSPAPRPAEPSPQRSHSPKKPPSPPQSIRAVEDTESSGLGRPAFRDDVFRPSSRGSHRNVSTTLKEVQNAWDVPADYGPTSIPSPILTPRGSEETTSSSVANIWGEPVIRMVAARRDTLTSIAPLRRSLEMKVEKLERPYREDITQRPKTSNGPQMRRLTRPPPLNLDARPRTPDRAGTYPPAPFATGQRPHTPTGEGPYQAFRDRTGPPPAAVGAYGRPGRPNVRGVQRPTADEYEVQPQLQPQLYSPTHRISQGSSNYERPPSPDSPLMPLTGPLASSLASSPRLAPVESSQLAPPPLKGGWSRPRPRDPSPSPLRSSPTSSYQDDDMDLDLPAPRPGHRNVPTPDSSDWPLPQPSPSASSFDTASRSLSPYPRAEEADPYLNPYPSPSPYQYQFPDAGGSGLQTPPRVLPGVARAESPFGFRSNFNFSRPMTPTQAQRDAQLVPPRRADTVPVTVPVPVSPGTGKLPLPRAHTVGSHGKASTGGNVGVGRGLRSPAIVGDDFGGGFI
ncbi:hypothetical protein GGR54DRAFT_342094 [Hypoxylon sp. NC1633]|nr:hypothetical protein GGR54DRAFT_342094 [Hypoxylon sp. NC1633]